MSALEQLKHHSVVVADTGDFQAMAQFAPRDATTNPSLILKAVQKPEYAALMHAVRQAYPAAPLDEQVDRLLVEFGERILQVIPGRVSTEVDARLSFDTQATVERARRIMALYRAKGIDPSRVLIKIASTWEGIQAAAILEKEGIRCNLTLLFCIEQAVACAQAGVRLISPFVGRIYDWAKKQAGSHWDESAMAGEHDPGVKSVRRIVAYYRQNGIATEIMGASFRNVGQILALSGCDLLTISPELLAQLAALPAQAVTCHLGADWHTTQPAAHFDRSETAFRFGLNEDAMATEKLAEGIRAFVADARKLDALIQQA
jgi:transaldolase